MEIEKLHGIQAQAWAAIQELEVPDPPFRYVLNGVRVHETLGPDGEPLLIAFGRVPFPQWLGAVNVYHEQAPVDSGLDPMPWDLDDLDKVVDALGRISYDRVLVTLHQDAEEGSFTIHWNTYGVTPITVWKLGGDR